MRPVNPETHIPKLEIVNTDRMARPSTEEIAPRFFHVLMDGSFLYLYACTRIRFTQDSGILSSNETRVEKERKR